MDFLVPVTWVDDAEEELNQLLNLPPLFSGDFSSNWDTSLLLDGSAPDCIAAFSALDLTVPPPPPTKAPVPIAPAVFLPAAENISMERRLKRANDAPPRTVTKKTYQAVAPALRGMEWLNQLLRRSHDHCRLLESPLKVALRAQNYAKKQKSTASDLISPNATSPAFKEFIDALKHGESFLQPNQLDMRDRVLESCESDQNFLRLIVAAIHNLPADSPAAEIESVKISRRHLRKFIKQPALIPQCIASSSLEIPKSALPEATGKPPPLLAQEASPILITHSENVFKVEVS